MSSLQDKAKEVMNEFYRGEIPKKDLKTFKEYRVFIANYEWTGSIATNARLSMAATQIEEAIKKKESNHFNWLILIFTVIGAIAATVAAYYSVTGSIVHEALGFQAQANQPAPSSSETLNPSPEEKPEL